MESKQMCGTFSFVLKTNMRGGQYSIQLSYGRSQPRFAPHWKILATVSNETIARGPTDFLQALCSS